MSICCRFLLTTHCFVFPFLSVLLFWIALIAITFAGADSPMNIAQRVHILLFSLCSFEAQCADWLRGPRLILDGPHSFHAMLQAEPAFARLLLFLFYSPPRWDKKLDSFCASNAQDEWGCILVLQCNIFQLCFIRWIVIELVQVRARKNCFFSPPLPL